MRFVPFVLILVLLSGCATAPEPLRIASTGIRAYRGYEETAVESLSQSGTTTEYLECRDLIEAASAVASRKAQLAILPADLAFTLYSEEPAFRRLKGISLVGVLYLHLVVTQEDTLSIRDLEGRAIGVEADQHERLLELLSMTGVDLGRLQASQFERGGLARAMREADVEAALFLSPLGDPEVSALLEQGFVLAELDNATISQIKARNPFAMTVKLPSEVYGAPKDLRSVGLQLILVGSDDLDQDRAYLLSSVFPGDTNHLLPLPLHEGSLNYARERNLIP